MLLTTDLCYIYTNISLAFRLANIVSTRPRVLFECSLICDFWGILFLPDFLDCSCSLCIVVWAANLPALVLIGVLLLFDFPSLSISDVLLSLHFVYSAFCPSCNPYPDIEILAFRIMAWVFRLIDISMFWGFTRAISISGGLQIDTATYMLVTSGPCTHVVIKQLYVMSIAYNHSMQPGALQ